MACRGMLGRQPTKATKLPGSTGIVACQQTQRHSVHRKTPKRNRVAEIVKAQDNACVHGYARPRRSLKIFISVGFHAHTCLARGAMYAADDTSQRPSSTCQAKTDRQKAADSKACAANLSRLESCVNTAMIPTPQYQTNPTPLWLQTSDEPCLTHKHSRHNRR